MRLVSRERGEYDDGDAEHGRPRRTVAQRPLSCYRAGRYERIARGVYASADSATDWEWLEAATRRPDATICLISALAHHDLTDAIPAALDIAIPRGAHPPPPNRLSPGIPLTSQLSTSVVVKSRSVTLI